jgi:REP element-mobilizing transposase RayT
VWECKYHIVWVPKRRRKVIYGRLRVASKVKKIPEFAVKIFP